MNNLHTAISCPGQCNTAGEQMGKSKTGVGSWKKQQFVQIVWTQQAFSEKDEVSEWLGFEGTLKPNPFHPL